MSTRINTLKVRVGKVLEGVPRTRNSDTSLTCHVWDIFYPEFLFKTPDGDTAVKLKHIKDLPSEDQISRIRRKFQEAGQYVPTDKAVALQRGFNEEEWRTWALNS